MCPLLRGLPSPLACALPVGSRPANGTCLGHGRSEAKRFGTIVPSSVCSEAVGIHYVVAATHVGAICHSNQHDMRLKV